MIAAALIAAAALWPVFIAHQSDEVAAADAAAAVVAPVDRDYEERDRLVSFWEAAVREQHRGDMLSPRELAGQYLQRYRETGDIGDVLRAEAMARRSLAVAPRNIAALAEMASVMVTLHRFRQALSYADALLTYDPANADFLARRASLEMELGEYAAADASLRRIASSDRSGAGSETALARFDELTGKLASARRLLADATAQADAQAEESAQSRSWYHVRAGELAFEAGDNAGAIAAEREALTIFPTDNVGLKDLAKFELANGHAAEALDAATRGARVTPFPETLGYEADAQAALGDANDSAATRDLIDVVDRLGNAYRVNDRLLAIYYADHRVHTAEAFTIALRETTVRGDEIYAQDTLAWAAAMAGHWEIARRSAAKALRYGTEDPIVHYHAAIIALHDGRTGDATSQFRAALAANPHFNPVFADDARRKLAQLSE